MQVSSSQIPLRASPLTAEAFQPFGAVIEHCSVERRHVIEADFSRPGRDLRQAIWVSRLTEHCSLPIAINQLERHPHSQQAFIPLLGKPFLVICCPDLADGAPDISGARAFVAGPHQGVIYHRNVWHAGLQVLDAPAEFVVVMAVSGGQDDIMVDLDMALRIEDGAAIPEESP